MDENIFDKCHFLDTATILIKTLPITTLLITLLFATLEAVNVADVFRTKFYKSNLDFRDKIIISFSLSPSLSL
jgi:hypothetical protein